jgi:hypothetical protein
MRLILALLALAVLQGCGKYAELDPRDEKGASEWEDSCNRTSPSVTLNIENRSTFSFRIRIHRDPRGPGWPVLPSVQIGPGKTSRSVPRMFLDGRGFITLELTGGGMIFREPGPIYMTPLICDVGTLVVEPDPAMSNYVGMDI